MSAWALPATDIRTYRRSPQVPSIRSQRSDEQLPFRRPPPVRPTIAVHWQAARATPSLPPVEDNPTCIIYEPGSLLPGPRLAGLRWPQMGAGYSEFVKAPKLQGFVDVDTNARSHLPSRLHRVRVHPESRTSTLGNDLSSEGDEGKSKGQGVLVSYEIGRRGLLE